MSSLQSYADFLTKRYDEAEEIAQAAIEDDNGSDEGFAEQYEALTKPPSGVGLASGGFGDAAARMIATYAVPKAILEDIKSKRAVLAQASKAQRFAGNGEAFRDGLSTAYWEAVVILARPFRDHPDHPENLPDTCKPV